MNHYALVLLIKRGNFDHFHSLMERKCVDISFGNTLDRVEFTHSVGWQVVRSFFETGHFTDPSYFIGDKEFSHSVFNPVQLKCQLIEFPLEIRISFIPELQSVYAFGNELVTLQIDLTESKGKNYREITKRIFLDMATILDAIFSFTQVEYSWLDFVPHTKFTPNFALDSTNFCNSLLSSVMIFHRNIFADWILQFSSLSFYQIMETESQTAIISPEAFRDMEESDAIDSIEETFLEIESHYALLKSFFCSGNKTRPI